MQPKVDEARELMAEGDRLLGRAWEYGRSWKPGATPADLDLAGHYYAQAAQAYLVGAVEYQHGRAATRDGAAMEETGDLVQALDGRLRTEAEAAISASCERVRDGAPDTAVERARVFAEELRDRFADAAPELFHGPIDPGFKQTQEWSMSR
jgi:hypothetical protein